MEQSRPSSHWLPRARVDPIRSPGDALIVISLAACRPLVDETIVVALDHARRGVFLTAVDGTTDADAVRNVVECFAATAAQIDAADALVVASVRPDKPIDIADIDRWLDASEIADRFGVELVEWFVINGSTKPDAIGCPRELIGESARW